MSMSIADAASTGAHCLKILFVVGGLPFGGVETMTLLTAKELRKRGHQPVIVNISGTGEYHQAYVDAGFPPETLGSNKKVLKTTSVSTVRKMRQLIRRIQPDIIHTAHFSANYHTRLAAIALGIPVVTHIRNIKHERPSRRLADKLLSFATDKYIAVSGMVADLIEKEHNVAKRPVDVIYNAISEDKMDVAPLDVTEIGVTPGVPLIVCCSRLVSQKNLDLVVAALGQVRESLPETELLILGDGPERTRLESLADERGLREAVTFTGFRRDVPQILQGVSQQQSIFAMPSDYEGFSNSLTEAMYCGLPGIISNYVPNKEVTEGATVLVRRDSEDIARNMLAILGSEEAYSRMREKAKRIARSLTVEKHVDTLLVVYSSLVQS
ncbi:glycosyltransferase [Desulfobaculum senezii]